MPHLYFYPIFIKNKVYILLQVGYNHRHSANHRQWFRQSGKIWPESNFLLIVIVVSTCAQEIMHVSTIAMGRFSHIFGEARIHPNHSTYYYILLWRETLQIFIVGSLCVYVRMCCDDDDDDSSGRLEVLVECLHTDKKKVKFDGLTWATSIAKLI